MIFSSPHYRFHPIIFILTSAIVFCTFSANKKYVSPWSHGIIFHAGSQKVNVKRGQFINFYPRHGWHAQIINYVAALFATPLCTCTVVCFFEKLLMMHFFFFFAFASVGVLFSKLKFSLGVKRQHHDAPLSFMSMRLVLLMGLSHHEQQHTSAFQRRNGMCMKIWRKNWAIIKSVKIMKFI